MQLLVELDNSQSHCLGLLNDGQTEDINAKDQTFPETVTKELVVHSFVSVECTKNDAVSECCTDPSTSASVNDNCVNWCRHFDEVAVPGVSGLIRSMSSVLRLIDEFSREKGLRVVEDRRDARFGIDYNPLPKDAHRFQVLWELSAKHGLAFDGIPFISVASQILKIQPSSESGKYSSTCNNYDEAIVIHELLRFPKFMVAQSLEGQQLLQKKKESDRNIVSALKLNTVSFERAFFVSLPQCDNRNVGFHNVQSRSPPSLSSFLLKGSALSRFQQGEDKLLHLPSHPQNCIICGWSVSSPKALLEHVTRQHQCCHLCRRSCTKSNILWHLAIVHPIFLLESKTETMQCVYCHECRFTKRFQLIEHYGTVHGLGVSLQLKKFLSEEEFIAWKAKMFRSLELDNCEVDGYVYRTKCNKEAMLANTKCRPGGVQRGTCPVFLHYYRDLCSSRIVAQYCTRHVGHVLVGSGSESDSMCANRVVEDNLLSTYGKVRRHIGGKQAESTSEHDPVEDSCPVDHRYEQQRVEVQLMDDLELQRCFDECLKVDGTGTPLLDQAVCINDRLLKIASKPVEVALAPLLCKYCGQNVKSLDMLALHYTEKHNTPCRIDAVEFSSPKEFFNWKLEIELKFRHLFGKSVKYSASTESASNFYYLCCADSNLYKERSCPAFIKVKWPSGIGHSVSVQCCLYHTGHDQPKENEFWSHANESLYTKRFESAKKKWFWSTNAVNRTTEKAKEFVDWETASVAYCEELLSELKKNALFLYSNNDFTCSVCKLPFLTRKSLLCHIKEGHWDIKKRKKGTIASFVTCMICGVYMNPPAMRNLVHHYNIVHGKEFMIMLRCFYTEEQFENWRLSLNDTFLKLCWTFRASVGLHRSNFICKHSGELKVTSSKSKCLQMSGFCPAWIMVQRVKGYCPIRVFYCLDHLGHATASVTNSNLTNAEVEQLQRAVRSAEEETIRPPSLLGKSLLLAPVSAHPRTDTASSAKPGLINVLILPTDEQSGPLKLTAFCNAKTTNLDMMSSAQTISDSGPCGGNNSLLCYPRSQDGSQSSCCLIGNWSQSSNSQSDLLATPSTSASGMLATMCSLNSNVSELQLPIDWSQSNDDSIGAVVETSGFSTAHEHISSSVLHDESVSDSMRDILETCGLASLSMPDGISFEDVASVSEVRDSSQPQSSSQLKNNHNLLTPKGSRTICFSPPKVSAATSSTVSDDIGRLSSANAKTETIKNTENSAGDGELPNDDVSAAFARLVSEKLTNIGRVFVSVRSQASGNTWIVTVAINELPVVEHNGLSYYALNDTSFLMAVSRSLQQSGKVLTAGDEIEVMDCDQKPQLV